MARRQMLGLFNSFTLNPWHLSPTGVILSTAVVERNIGGRIQSVQQIALVSDDTPVGIGPTTVLPTVREGNYALQTWHSRDRQMEWVYDVVRPEGDWLGTLALPTEAGELLDVRGDRVLTMALGQFDEIYLRVYRLQRR